MFVSRSRVLVFAGIFALVAGRSAFGLLPTVKTLQLVEDNSSLRVALGGDRIAAIYGSVIDSANVPSTYATTRAFVDAFLLTGGGLLGVDGAEFDYVDEMNIRNNKFTVFTYRQTIQGLPVHARGVRVLVLLGTTEEKKITYVGTNLSELPPTALPSTNDITAQDAIDLVDLSPAYEPLYGHLTFTDAQGADNVVYEARDGTLHRVWRFEGETQDRQEGLRFLVDTTTGVGLVGVENLVFNFEGAIVVEGTGEYCCHPGRPDWPSCCPSGTADCCCEETDVDYPECAFKCWAAGLPRVGNLGISLALGSSNV